MRYHRILGLAAFTAPTTTYAEPTLSVTVTDGPTECADNEKVKPGNYASMHYTGTIDESSETGEKGKKFDSFVDRGETFDVQIGLGKVIKGWDEGIVGLCKGAKATLIIPPDMGYGAHGAGDAIPGGATLNFEVEVVDIKDGPPPGQEEPNLFDALDANNDGYVTKEEVDSYFKEMGQAYGVPPELWEEEDKDKDGKISWEEFSGPKGNAPAPSEPSDEGEL